FQGAPRFKPARRTPESAILGTFAGFLKIAVQGGKIVLRLPGSSEWVEIGQGRVVVKIGPKPTEECLLEASRLVTYVLDLDGRRNQLKISGGKTAILRREGDTIRVTMAGQVTMSKRFTLEMPGMSIVSSDANRREQQREP